MSTQKQIEANRLNALKSTGPATPEAKSKTRLNAKRDGLTGQVTTLSDEDRPIFESLTRRSRNQTGKSVTMPKWASNY